VPQLIPGETAIDEKHRAIRISRRPRRGTNGVRSLADQQRLIAGNEVNARQIPSQRCGKLIGAYTQLERLR
jgi:hypothetical protein